MGGPRGPDTGLTASGLGCLTIKSVTHCTEHLCDHPSASDTPDHAAETDAVSLFSRSSPTALTQLRGHLSAQSPTLKWSDRALQGGGAPDSWVLCPLEMPTCPACCCASGPGDGEEAAVFTLPGTQMQCLVGPQPPRHAKDGPHGGGVTAFEGHGCGEAVGTQQGGRLAQGSLRLPALASTSGSGHR